MAISLNSTLPVQSQYKKSLIIKRTNHFHRTYLNLCLIFLFYA